MTDFYRDTADRERHDVDFAHAVDMLCHLAMKHGFTPGELKQIAFRAALRMEMLSVRSIQVPTSVLQETADRFNAELRRRALDVKP